MDTHIAILVIKNRKKLEQMILEKKPYKKVVKQSQILDKYILKQFKVINKIRS